MDRSGNTSEGHAQRRPPLSAGTGRRTHRRTRRLVLAGLLGLVVGIAAGGIVLDERTPDLADLRLPEPTAAGPNPLAWAVRRPSPALDGAFETLAALDFPRAFPPHEAHGAPRAPEETDAPLAPALADLRAELEPWMRDFEHEFERVGGDPRVAIPPRDRPWSPLPPPSSELTTILALGVRLDVAANDLGGALARQHLVLRVECWRARAGGLPFATPGDRFGPILAAIDGLIELVERGALPDVRDRRILGDIGSWHLDGAITGLAAAHFSARRDRWDDPTVRRETLGTEAWGVRVKERRAERRFAEGVRRARDRILAGRGPVDPEPRFPPQSTVVRTWIDPHGDTILAAEEAPLATWEARARTARAGMRALRVAIAVERRRRDGWSLATLPFGRTIDLATGTFVDDPGAAPATTTNEVEWLVDPRLGAVGAGRVRFERAANGAAAVVVPSVEPPLRVLLPPPRD